MIKIFENTQDKKLADKILTNLKFHKQLDKEALYYIEQIRFPAPDYIAINLEGKKVLGWFAFDINEKTGDLYDHGIYIIQPNRGSHLAEKLWDFVLKNFIVKTVEVETLSLSGRGLINKLKTKYTNIKWVLL